MRDIERTAPAAAAQDDPVLKIFGQPMHEASDEWLEAAAAWYSDHAIAFGNRSIEILRVLETRWEQEQ